MEKSTGQYNAIKSFTCAIKGLVHVFSIEFNARLQLVISLIVICMGILFAIKTSEWVLIIICMGMVIGAETVNTAIERLTDMVSPQFNEKARTVKDISAGAVLLVSIISLFAGLLIFLPYIIGSVKEIL